MITIAIYVKDNNIELALKELRKQSKKDNIIIDYMKHQEFTPKSVEKRRRKYKGKRRWEKINKRNNDE